MRRRSAERGAAIVEMALVAPMLMLLVVGVVEFGYLFGIFNEVRHAAREGARYAAVSNASIYDGNSNGTVEAEDVFDVTCQAINLPPGSSIDIDLTRSGSDVGSAATVEVTVSVPSLTQAPLIAQFLPAELSNTASFRLEQPATWDPDDAFTGC